MRLKHYLLLCFIAILSACTENKAETTNLESKSAIEQSANHVRRVDTDELIVLYPDFSKVDLACGEMPSKSDSNVILVVAGAYTGELLKDFKHSNIAGDHVSNGVRYKGYKCARNTGAFVYYNNKWKFCHRRYSHELDSAAIYNGAAFTQELIIHNGEILATTRTDGNKNCFRALCSHGDSLCVIESKSVIAFGKFKNALLEHGVTDAIYLDMGTGWNYAWYRCGSEVINLHPKAHGFCTNWVTFYR